MENREQDIRDALASGEEVRVNNPQPQAVSCVVRTEAGSVISFTIPVGGSATILSGGDITGFRMDIDSLPRGLKGVDIDH